MGKNELLPKINAEKNTLALEQAQATLKQLKATYELKRRAAEADIRILQIRRDRAANAERQAAGNAERMSIHAPIAGMAVVKTIWKGNNMAEVQEGEEVRAGVPVVDIVNPERDARARAGEPGGRQRAAGRPAGARRPRRLSGAVLRRPGRADLAARRDVGALAKVRTFIVLVDVDGSHPNLMPDLSASLDVTLARTPRAIVVPRDALRQRRRQDVRPRRSAAAASRIGRSPLVRSTRTRRCVASGLDEGAVIARNVRRASRRSR